MQMEQCFATEQEADREKGRIFFGPSAGRDIASPLCRFGDEIDEFLFVDIGYRSRALGPKLIRQSIPRGWVRLYWTLVVDDTRRTYRSAGKAGRPFTPHEFREVWLSRNQKPVRIVLRWDHPDEFLETRPDNSIDLFMTPQRTKPGEDLGWLRQQGPRMDAPDPRGKPLLERLSRKLAHGATIITDGQNADIRFLGARNFHACGCDFLRLFLGREDHAERPRPISWRVGKCRG